MSTAKTAFTQALALHRAGRLGEAEAAYRRYLAAFPKDGPARVNLGVLLRSLGRTAAAEAEYRRVLSDQPGQPDAAFNLANLYRATGRLDQALTLYRDLLARGLDKPAILNNCGQTLTDLGRPAEALPLLEQAVAQAPDHALAWNNLGMARMKTGADEAAAAAFAEAARLAPDHSGIALNWSVALKLGGQLEQARAVLEATLARDPDNPEALAKLASVLDGLGQGAEAEHLVRRALELAPESPAIRNHWGCLLLRRDRAAAEAAFAEALAFDPDFADAHWNLSLALLVRGALRDGFRAYEWRWRRTDIATPPDWLALPQWDGQALAGRSLLVVAEQGLGDSLQFLRYLEQIPRDGPVTVWLQAALAPLMAGYRGALDGIDLVYDSSTIAGRPFDCQAALLSLPYILGTELDTIPTMAPGGLPYLTADPARQADWQARFEAAPALAGKRRFGLVWRGNPKHRNDRNRSLPTETAAAWVAQMAAQRPDLAFVSLQKEAGEAERAQMAAAGLALDAGPDLHSFADTAAALSALDGLIAVDTSVLHLAGALGRPAFALLATPPDWRWLEAGATTPWYPSLTLIRQPTPGDWAAVLSALKAAL